MINKGYLTAKSDKESDEYYTPFYAVEPLIKHLKRYRKRLNIDLLKIWCPFDEPWSAFVVTLKESGFIVINTHIDDVEEHNFFYYEPPEDYHIIVSNPPFSMKDDVLKRLQELNKPYAMLLPLNTIQGEKRFKYLSNIQVLAFDKRINFHTLNSIDKTISGVAFASIYICKDILEKDFILEELIRKEKPLL